MSEPETTTGRTIIRGATNAGGWADLTYGPDEGYQQPLPEGHVLAAIWHLSDLHVCDAESPARQEYLDRYSDPDSEYRQILGDIGTYRPQEILTVQVATTMVETVNSLTKAPVSGQQIDAVIITGDVTDNAQHNELGWYLGIVEGGTISPRSGSETISSWVGVTDEATWDDRYWHPDGPPPNIAPDRQSELFGYPRIKGLVDAARRDVVSPGIDLPWFSVHGNHDSLLQGTCAPTPELNELAIGDARIIGLADGQTPMIIEEGIAQVGPGGYTHNHSSPQVTVTADTRRALLASGDFAAAHGWGQNYWVRDIGELRVISLDTVNPHGGWQGSIDPAQFSWLGQQLAEASNEYVVITSHHPSPTIINHFAPVGAPPRILGPEITELLLAHPQVIAWVAGHVHHHAALWHGREAGVHEGGSGFWEITTSSLIDWPQQGRILEFIKEQGSIAIVSTVVDHRGPAGWVAEDLGNVTNLASISRSLAANDYRLRGDALRGLILESSPAVRNTVWRVADPHGSLALPD